MPSCQEHRFAESDESSQRAAIGRKRFQNSTNPNSQGSAHWDLIDTRCNERARLQASLHSNEAASARNQLHNQNRLSSFAGAPPRARAGNRVTVTAAWLLAHACLGKVDALEPLGLRRNGKVGLLETKRAPPCQE